MDVNVNWHMHQVSDGQRRRVQIVLGLLMPWEVLLLDEVTVDLDVVVRANLLAFLKKETETRGATYNNNDIHNIKTRLRYTYL